MCELSQAPAFLNGIICLLPISRTLCPIIRGEGEGLDFLSSSSAYSRHIFLTSFRSSSRYWYACPLPTPGSPRMIADVWIRRPLDFDGMVYTVAFKDPTFKHPESTTRTNSGGNLSPAATFKSTARTDGRRHCTDYFAHDWLSLILSRLSAKWFRPTVENFMSWIKK